MINIDPLMSVISFPRPLVETKGWGSEIVLINCPDYCSKILRFNEGSKGSMHFHCKKHETWRILDGEILLEWIDTSTAARHTKVLYVGDIVDIPRLCPHQVYAVVDSLILEVSTPHYDDDSYRVSKGDSQK